MDPRDAGQHHQHTSLMDDEYKAITATLHAFVTFHQWQYEQVLKPKSIKWKLLSNDEQQLLDFYPLLIRDLGQCIDINRLFTELLAVTAAQDWGIDPNPSAWAPAAYSDYDKVRSTLLQFAREWSDEGIGEREQTFGRLLDKVCDLYGEENRDKVKVLVPGCGLGRLVYEFVKRGFWTQGNEVSYHMLLALGFVLNHTLVPHSHTIFPYIHRLSHLARRLYQVRPVQMPDESGMSIFSGNPEEDAQVGELMSMAAGSFVDLYGPPGLAESETYSLDATASQFRSENANRFDVVATCFFVDTASNIIDYLKSIHHCLKDDGVWVNIGPLHWHFEGDLSTSVVKKVMEHGKEPQEVLTTLEGLELSREELFLLMDKIGFDVEHHESGIQTTYSTDTKALLNFSYHVEFWVARKRTSVNTQA